MAEGGDGFLNHALHLLLGKDRGPAPPERQALPEVGGLMVGESERVPMEACWDKVGALRRSKRERVEVGTDVEFSVAATGPISCCVGKGGNRGKGEVRGFAVV